ncbi:MAG: phage major capsid protein [Clostridium sp.]|uniref:phage major capsid protein n=1 Tax=Clostridium sp. TaxID=1506 RepID=UPI003F2AF107
MRIDEIKQQITELTGEVRSLSADKDLEGAKAKMEELRQLKETLKIEKELQEEEERDLINQKEERKVDDKKMGKVSEMRSIVKSLMGENLTPEERSNISTVDNSAIIPSELVNQMQKIKKGFGSLKEYCDVIPVTKNTGTIPVIDLDQNEFPEVKEGDNIVDGKLVTTDLAFKCAKHGLIQSLNSETIDDAVVEVESLVKDNFAEIVTRAENTKILKVIKDNATEVAGATTYEDVENTIDTSLPSIKNGLSTITNVVGFAYLKNMKDKQGRNLGLVTELNGKYYFDGKELITVDDTLLPVSEGKTHVFYVVNIKEAVKFCDRKALTLARSSEAGFEDDTVKLRILERFDVTKGCTRSIKKIEF